MKSQQSPRSPLYVIGDLHGHVDRLLGLLASSGLVGPSGQWLAGRAQLWFVGDLIDRGPSGVEVIHLVRHLQDEAEAAGGTVGCLLGNHEVLFLAARQFGADPEWGNFFVDCWRRNGGQLRDTGLVEDTDVMWLQKLPAIQPIDVAPSLSAATSLPLRENRPDGHRSVLLLHADSDFYLRYGSTPTAINDSIQAVLRSGGARAWQDLLENFTTRHAFDGTRPGGQARAETFLNRFQADRLVHGHTPISKVRGLPDSDIHEAYPYASGICINVDGGIYRGGEGFVLQVA